MSSTVAQQVVLSWTPPAYNGDLIQKYMVKSPQGGNTYIDVDNTASSYTFTSENANSARLFQIVAAKMKQAER